MCPSICMWLLDISNEKTTIHIYLKAWIGSSHEKDLSVDHDALNWVISAPESCLRHKMTSSTTDKIPPHMMTSSNGNIFRVTGHLCGKFTGPGEFPAQRPVTRSFDVFFDLRLNKRLSKQPWGWWFETPAWSLWRHRNAITRRDINSFIKVLELWNYHCLPRWVRLYYVIRSLVYIKVIRQSKHIINQAYEHHTYVHKSAPKASSPVSPHQNG